MLVKHRWEMMGLFRKKQAPVVRTPRLDGEVAGYTFRRSRTLTGTTAENVRVVSESQAQLKSPRLHEHELRTHRRRLGTYLVGALGCVVCLALLLSQFIGIVRMSPVSTSPLVHRPNIAQYQALVDEYFASHPFERFRFVLNKTDFAHFLDTKAPEVESIEFAGRTLATAEATLRLREPLVAWQFANQRYYVDANGRSFTRNFYHEPAITVKDMSGIDPTSGAIVSDRFLRFMGRVIALTNASGLKVSGVTIPRGTTREIDLQLEGRGYTIKTLLDRDPASQATDIINAVKFVDAQTWKPLYIDVRIASKAVYR